ncbi:TauD/TfdA family dioxygenase [Lentzea sp. NPDC004789]
MTANLGKVRKSAPSKISLTRAEADGVVELASSITEEAAVAPEKFCAAASRAARRLPDRIQDALSEFRRWGSDTGTFLIQGMPIGPVPMTPPDNTRHVGETTILARAHAMVNEFLGHMVAYEAEGFGRLFQDMVPSRAAASTQTSLGSSTELELHTEQAFSALRPDYISLSCLRGDPGAETYTLTATQLDAAITAGDRLVMRQKWWHTGVDESFRAGGHAFDEGDRRGPLAILDGAEEDPFIVFDQDLMEGMNVTAAAACKTLIEVYRAKRNRHVLKPGELLIVDNRRAVHGRSPFHARFDGSDRFIIRTFVTTDLARSRFARPGDGRTIAARFS